MSATYAPHGRGYARIAGLLYFTIAVAGGFSIAWVPSQIMVAGDATATIQALTTKRSLFNLGIGGETIVMLAEVAVTAMLFFMFRPVSPTLSLIAAFARLTMAVVMAAMLLFTAAAMSLIDPAGAFEHLPGDMRDTLAMLMLTTHDAGVLIWQLFFTLHLFILGLLVMWSGTYPRLLGAMMALGSLGYIMDSALKFLTVDIGALTAIKIGLLAIVTIAEVGFALWLIVRGPRT